MEVNQAEDRCGHEDGVGWRARAKAIVEFEFSLIPSCKADLIPIPICQEELRGGACVAWSVYCL